MSRYKLADGSLSSIYKVGDEFEVFTGDTVIADEIVGNNFYSGIYLISWSWVKPTPETKRKVHYRETGKWLVLEGDYVVHADMTFKQFKEWCDAAKACGFSLDHVNTNVCVITFANDEGDLVSSWYTDIGAKTNTTDEFLEFLAKEEKAVKKFTKADLQGGMLVEYRDGDIRMVWNGSLFDSGLSEKASLSEYSYKLNHRYHNSMDIVGIYKRPPLSFTKGDIIWKREEEPTELTIEEIAEKFNIPVEQLRIKK